MQLAQNLERYEMAKPTAAEKPTVAEFICDLRACLDENGKPEFNFKEITTKVNQAGYKTKSGRKWTESSVHRTWAKAMGTMGQGSILTRQTQPVPHTGSNKLDVLTEIVRIHMTDAKKVELIKKILEVD